MKYSTATLVVLAHGIVAAPSLLSQLSHKNGKVDRQSAGEDITLSIKVSQSPMKKAVHRANDICWAACFSDEPECPTDWNAGQFGDCWTCCQSFE